MAWIPIIAASQNCNRNRNKKGITIALIVLLLLGSIILISQLGVFNHITNFPLILVSGLVIVLFIVGIMITVISANLAKRDNQNPYPYQYNNEKYHEVSGKAVYQSGYQRNPSERYNFDSKRSARIKSCYCSYCGCYLSQDAVFCPDCGKRIE